MSIPVFIPYVNRFDLLQKAVASVPRRGTTGPVVWNNSGKQLDLPCEIVYPLVPLTFAQTQNAFIQLAKERGVPFYFFMHSDAEAGADTVDVLYHMAMEECASGRKWGAIFTNYDALAAFNTEAFDRIGGWDTALEWYHSDGDVYRRLKLAGYPCLESNLPVKHEPSQTLKADPLIKLRVDVMAEARRKWYIAKWGGDMHQERFLVPFNGRFVIE